MLISVLVLVLVLVVLVLVVVLLPKLGHFCKAWRERTVLLDKTVEGLAAACSQWLTAGHLPVRKPLDKLMSGCYLPDSQPAYLGLAIALGCQAMPAIPPARPASQLRGHLGRVWGVAGYLYY